MTFPSDHIHDLDLGVSRSEFEIALSQEWDGWLTWNEKDVSHPLMTMILTSVTMVGWADLLDSDQGDFRHQRAVDISSCKWKADGLHGKYLVQANNKENIKLITGPFQWEFASDMWMPS